MSFRPCSTAIRLTNHPKIARDHVRHPRNLRRQFFLRATMWQHRHGEQIRLDCLHKIGCSIGRVAADAAGLDRNIRCARSKNELLQRGFLFLKRPRRLARFGPTRSARLIERSVNANDIETFAALRVARDVTSWRERAGRVRNNPP